VRNDGHYALAHFLIPDEFGEEAGENHRRRGFTLSHAAVKFVVKLVVRQVDWHLNLTASRWHHPTQLTAAFKHVFYLGAVHARMIKWRIFERSVANREVQLVAECFEFIGAHLLFLMGRVNAFKSLAQRPALNRMSQNRHRSALPAQFFHSLVGGIQLAIAVPAATEPLDLLIAEMRNKF